LQWGDDMIIFIKNYGTVKDRKKMKHQLSILLMFISFLLFFLPLFIVYRFYLSLKLFEVLALDFLSKDLWGIVEIRFALDSILTSSSLGIGASFFCFLKVWGFLSSSAILGGKSEATRACSFFRLFTEGSLSVDYSRTDVREKLRNWLWLLSEWSWSTADLSWLMVKEI